MMPEQIIEQALFYCPAIQGFDWRPMIEESIKRFSDIQERVKNMDLTEEIATNQSVDPLCIARDAVCFTYHARTGRPVPPLVEKFAKRLHALYDERRKADYWGIPAWRQAKASEAKK